MWYVRDKETGEEIGSVITNHSMTTDEILDFAGLAWGYWEDYQTEGWSADGGHTVYDANDLEITDE